jgi:fucose 4-O-acetylase-like acetyltransferase
MKRVKNQLSVSNVLTHYKKIRGGKPMKERDAFFDNARFFLILLVVFGHLISPIKDNSDFLTGLYNFIYFFHMPAFILISGYFAKGFDKPGYLKKVFVKTLIPYAIFQLIYCFFYYFTGYENDFSLTLFDPHWTLWFLISLFFWNILLKLMAHLPYALPAAVLLGIAVGYVPFFGSYLSIDRTFVFFPMFLIGYYMHPEHFSILRSQITRTLAVTFLAGMFFATLFIIPDSFKEWLLGSHSYSDMGYAGVTAAGMRILSYLGMFLMTYSFLALVPRSRFRFTKIGSRTLYIYLLHGFFIKLISLSDAYQEMDDIYQYSALFLGSIIICIVLGSKTVRQIAKPIIELKPPGNRHTPTVKFQ